MSPHPPDFEPAPGFDNARWEVSTEEVEQLLDQGEDFLLLDCRSNEEWEKIHIPGAVSLPLQQMSTRSDELNVYQNKAIVIYCRTGRRSAIVAKFLSMSGYPHVRSMAGGLEAWAATTTQGKS